VNSRGLTVRARVRVKDLVGFIYSVTIILRLEWSNNLNEPNTRLISHVSLMINYCLYLA